MAIIMRWGAFILADNVEIMAIELGITADPSIKIVQSIGSVLHGVLMELVGIEYAGSYMKRACALIANISILIKKKVNIFGVFLL